MLQYCLLSLVLIWITYDQLNFLHSLESRLVSHTYRADRTVTGYCFLNNILVNVACTEVRLVINLDNHQFPYPHPHFVCTISQNQGQMAMQLARMIAYSEAALLIDQEITTTITVNHNMTRYHPTRN